MEVWVLFKRKLLLILSVTVLVLASIGRSSARSIIVDEDGPADFNNIQAAINDANDGDEVVVQPGTYTGDGNRDIDFLGKAITVRSVDPNDPTVVAATVIDCEGTLGENHRGFNFRSGEDAKSVLSGLTIRNGWGPSEVVRNRINSPPLIVSAGGGILCEKSSPLISNCIITDCYANYGGGIYGLDPNGLYPSSEGRSSPTIEDCNISGHIGGGISSCDGLIRNCIVSGNNYNGLENCNGTITNSVIGDNFHFGINGGNGLISDCIISNNGYAGISHFNGEISRCSIFGNSSGGLSYCSGLIENCLVYGNSGWGSGLEGCDGLIIGCTIVGNVSDESGGGLFECEGVIANCIIWDNEPNQVTDSYRPMFSCVEGGFDHVGNIDLDPCFVDAENGDYRLLSDSPCVDAGTNEWLEARDERDVGGNYRYIDGDGDGLVIVDMGAYEYGSVEAPAISLEPLTVEFSSGVGGPAEAETIYIRNLGIGTLDWRIGSHPRIEAVASSGECTDGVSAVELRIDVNGLALGKYEYELEIISEQANNSPLTISIDLIVHEAGLIRVPDDFLTIQSAIDGAVEDDEIIVSDGTYRGPGNRDIDFRGKSIMVRSENGADYCVIDCNGTEEEPHRGFCFESGEDGDSVLEGFTITNGWGPLEDYIIAWYSPQSLGGAILVANSRPTIRNCVMSGNVAGDGCSGFSSLGFGGGIACIEGNPLIRDCVIRDNIACYGGGIYGGHDRFEPNDSSPIIIGCKISGNIAHNGGGISGCDGEISGCEISDNNSSGSGGGLYGCDGSISGCTISGNLSIGHGGGMYECGGLISNCTIIENVITPGFRRGGGGGVFCKEAVPTITDCNISYNSADSGGGICMSSGPIIGCTIAYNQANYGGGLFSCDGDITDCNITGNDAATDGGGLCYCNGTISNCVVSYNTAERMGGGLAKCDGFVINSRIIGNSATMVGNTIFQGSFGGGICDCDGDISYCTISNNSAGGNGGGLAKCNGSIDNCMITGNKALYDGGGLWACPTIKHSIVSGNRAPRGGGVFSANSEANLIGSTISENIALQGGGIQCYAGSELLISNCIVWGNMAVEGPQVSLKAFYRTHPYPFIAPTAFVSYSDIDGGIEGIHLDPCSTLLWDIGNIDADPCFMQPGNWIDAEIAIEVNDPNLKWEEGDYHILPDSAVIDSGDPNYVPVANETDLDGNRRVIGSGVDMGAYEYVPLPIECEMWLTPQSLNLGSKGRWVKAHFVLPDGYVVEDVDVNRPCEVVELFDVESEYVRIYVNDDGFVEVEAVFMRSAFCNAGSFDGAVTVVGNLIDGRQFMGTDTIRVNDRSFERLAELADYWLAVDCNGPDWCGGLDSNEDGVVNFGDFALLGGCCIEVLGR